ncbi:hypothetical protein CY34DRAFT_797963 [Suillus luteus UH-Slu-Lm8-n1]|uniref:Uncharacterized protein n=1 Tax=Suillus luteus UH-Slu-Lm8-n1 TaxID=930992 RepID=A0A0D0C0V0_9AGAM|nr:hypothetical protein CY34DRAFT_797963 [Suillus luteus UH-Slu-Lm8-n1]
MSSSLGKTDSERKILARKINVADDHGKEGSNIPIIHLQAPSTREVHHLKNPARARR